MEKKELDSISRWREETGLSFIESPSEDIIKQALEKSGAGFGALHPRQQDEILSVLSSWYFFLSSEMGRTYARVVINGNAVDRAKLNMLKPAAEALKVKIETLKKIYDRRIRELTTKKQFEEN